MFFEVDIELKIFFSEFFELDDNAEEVCSAQRISELYTNLPNLDLA